MTRAEHLDWAKERALELLHEGDLAGAFTSMVSDLGKHPETRDHTGLQLGAMLFAGGFLDFPQKMREFIEGFN